MFKRIAVGTDGSQTASKALEHGVDLAKVVGAELVVISSYQGGASQFEGSAIELCRRVLDEVKERYAGSGVSLRTLVKEGAPADAIVQVAEEEAADLIVVGSVGMSKAGRVGGMGSVPNAVSHHASCNVLIVHTSAE